MVSLSIRAVYFLLKITYSNIRYTNMMYIKKVDKKSGVFKILCQPDIIKI